MNYPFEKLEKILEAFKGNVEKNIDNIDIAVLLQEAIDEVVICRTSFLRSVFTLKNKKQLRLIVQTSQLTLIALENRVMELYIYDSSTFAIADLLLQEMDLMLDFLAIYFSDCFDTCKAAPIHYVLAKQEKIMDNLTLFKESLKIEKQEKAAWKILFSEVEQVIKGMNKVNTSFHELLFLEHLFPIAESSEILFIETEFYTVSEIYLLQQGYNNDVFIERLVRKMHEKASETNDPIVFWEQQKKLLLQLRKRTVNVYRTDHADPITELLKYTEVELLYLYQINKLLNEPGSSNDMEGKTEKLMVSTLPVNQLAVILRLFVDRGYLKPMNQSAFFNKIAKVTGMGNKDSISAMSLRNKYYCPEKTAIEGVRDLFHGCLKDMGRY